MKKTIKYQDETCVNPLAEMPGLHVLTRSFVQLEPSHPVNICAYFQGEGSLDSPEVITKPHPKHVIPCPAPHKDYVLPHSHDYCEVSFVFSGTAEHITSQGCFEAGSGTVLFVPLREIHAFEHCKAWYTLSVCYLADWLLDDLRVLRREGGLLGIFLSPELFADCLHPGVLQCTLEEDELALCISEIDHIAVELKASSPSHLFMRACLYKILLCVARAAVRSQTGRTSIKLPAMIWSTIELIEQSVLNRQTLMVDEIARRLNVSVSHFARRFQESLGRSPKEYIQIRRIQYACKLLLDPSNSITEVAYALDFATPAHFTNVFRKYRGMSPREYRKRYSMTNAYKRTDYSRQ